MKRFTLVLLIGVLILAGLENFIFFQYQKQKSFNELRQNLMLIASNAALSIDAEEVLKVPLTQGNENNPAYQALTNKLLKIKQVNPSVKYVYIMTITDQPGIMQYVVDADPLPEIVTAKSPSAFSGDKYDARNLPQMMNAYYGPTADDKITGDVWGTFFSGYAPIRDASGKAIAILGVDIEVAHKLDLHGSA